MRKFLKNNGEIFDKIESFVQEYAFDFKRKSTYEFHLENEYCLLEFYTERYEDSLVFILTNRVTQKRYSGIELVSLKGGADLFSKISLTSDELLEKKILETIDFLKLYVSRELNGDFTSLG